MAEIYDGTTNTIMTGEMQRITVAGAGTATQTSQDGWSVAWATLFSTGAMVGVAGSNTGSFATYSAGNFPATDPLGNYKLMSNGFFGSPGSEHPGGTHFGMGDASVHFVNSSVDWQIFMLIGSMADRTPANVPQ